MHCNCLVRKHLFLKMASWWPWIRCVSRCSPGCDLHDRCLWSGTIIATLSWKISIGSLEWWFMTTAVVGKSQGSNHVASTAWGTHQCFFLQLWYRWDQNIYWPCWFGAFGKGFKITLETGLWSPLRCKDVFFPREKHLQRFWTCLVPSDKNLGGLSRWISHEACTPPSGGLAPF